MLPARRLDASGETWHPTVCYKIGSKERALCPMC